MIKVNVAVSQQPRQPRRLGIDRGMVVPPSFFEPLPDALLDAFEGEIRAAQGSAGVRGECGRCWTAPPAPSFGSRPMIRNFPHGPGRHV